MSDARQHSASCWSKSDYKPENGEHAPPCDCDGYHTFGELYEHRIALYIALCKELSRRMDVWRSMKHSDDTSMDGWFVMGINERRGRQITYHLPLSAWDDTEFCQTLNHAPDFDGHTSADVLVRLNALL